MLSTAVHGQSGPAVYAPSNPTIQRKVAEKDLGDVVHGLFTHRDAVAAGDENTKKHFSIIPAVGYTLQTGFAGLVSANLSYFNDTAGSSKMSSISTSITYSQYHQKIIPLQASIWTKGNQFNFITDIRYIAYPSDIYGLGGRTDPNKGYTINFSGIKIHQTVLKSVSENLYMGVGYYFDKFWNMQAIDQLTRVENRRLTKELGTEETASGPVVRFSYDTRLNQLNPQQGVYYNITYRSSLKSLGSDSNWQSLQIDARTYVHLPKNSRNVLGFWIMDWLTANGTPPYMLLPSTGWDDTYNTGRGYIQGRFRGRNMLYFESEYRYNISANGLIGGVAFVNIQNFSSDLSAQYSRIIPGYGAGLRIKLNKQSGANLCIDYGFGQNGSRGFFVNLGEVF